MTTRIWLTFLAVAAATVLLGAAPDIDNLDGLAPSPVAIPAPGPELVVDELAQPGPGEYWNSVFCTGSMEPAVTCLDILLYRAKGHFAPKDIGVGTIISYTLDPFPYDDVNSDALSEDCDYDNPSIDGGALHRVVDIKYENGSYHYWTRGDASETDDRCWKPFSTINSYVLAIGKNLLRTENAPLRDAFIASRAAYDGLVAAAWAAVEEVWATYEELTPDLDAAWTAYLELRNRYCSGHVCRSSAHYTLVIGAYDRYKELYDLAENVLAKYDVVVPQYEDTLAADHPLKVIADCWYKNTLHSKKPGHIPYDCPEGG